MVLDGYGLHKLVLKDCDEYIGGGLIASPADAQGRGIEFSLEEDGETVALAGAQVYLAWHHRVSRKRGCEPFMPVDGDKSWRVFYPAAMQECAGTVDAQVVVSQPGGRTISTRVFGIRVEPVVIGGTESEDGFTLFIDVIKRYEKGAERVEELLAVLDDVKVIKGDKGDPGEKGDKGDPGEPGRDGIDGKDGADGQPGRDGSDGAPGRDGADGKDGAPGQDGKDGIDGVGIASVEQTVTSLADAGVNVMTVTLTDGTTSDFEVRNGHAGSGEGGTGGNVNLSVEAPLDMSAEGVLSIDLSDYATHSDVESATGLEEYTKTSDLTPGIWYDWDIYSADESKTLNYTNTSANYNVRHLKKGDLLFNNQKLLISRVTSVNYRDPEHNKLDVAFSGILDIPAMRQFVTTTEADVTKGETEVVTLTKETTLQPLKKGTIFFNPTSGNLMIARTDKTRSSIAAPCDVTIEGLCNLYEFAADGGNTGDGAIKGEKGDKGDPFTFDDFTEEQLALLKGDKGDKGDPGEKGEAGTDGAPGAKGDKGEPGEKGDKGDKGDPFTYEDFTEEQLLALKGEPGAKGDKGDKGDPGESGISEITVAEPLFIDDDGAIALNATNLGGGTKTYTVYGKLPNARQGLMTTLDLYEDSELIDIKVGDMVLDTKYQTLCQVQDVMADEYGDALYLVYLQCVAEFTPERLMVVQYGTVDVAKGQTKTVTVASNHYLAANTLVFNTTSGNLMRLTSQVNPTDPSSATTWNLIGLCNLYSPNMDGYVTSEELESAVNDAVSNLLNLEELNY